MYEDNKNAREGNDVLSSDVERQIMNFFVKALRSSEFAQQQNSKPQENDDDVMEFSLSNTPTQNMMLYGRRLSGERPRRRVPNNRISTHIGGFTPAYYQQPVADDGDVFTAYDLSMIRAITDEYLRETAINTGWYSLLLEIMKIERVLRDVIPKIPRTYTDKTEDVIGHAFGQFNRNPNYVFDAAHGVFNEYLFSVVDAFVSSDRNGIIRGVIPVDLIRRSNQMLTSPRKNIRAANGLPGGGLLGGFTPQVNFDSILAPNAASEKVGGKLTEDEENRFIRCVSLFLNNFVSYVVWTAETAQQALVTTNALQNAIYNMDDAATFTKISFAYFGQQITSGKSEVHVNRVIGGLRAILKMDDPVAAQPGNNPYGTQPGNNPYGTQPGATANGPGQYDDRS